MSPPVPVSLPTGTPGLPPLGGRLFFAYRLTWWVLAAMAAATLTWSWVDPQAELGIALLRTAKTIVLIAVSTILYRRRRRDAVAAMLAVAFLLWTISSSVDFAADAWLPALIDRCRFLFFGLALMFFPDGEWRPAWTRYAAVAIVATFTLGVAEAFGLFPTRLFLPIAVGCVLAGLAALTMRYRSLEEGTQKQQLKWVTLGLFAGIGLILLARAGAALAANSTMTPFGAVLLESLFQLGIVIVALGFLTSLLRYRLYDAEAAISRSAVYAALTLTLVGTFAAGEVLFEILGERYFGMAIGNVSSAIAAGVAAALLTPLHGRISGWAEQRFQHDLASLKSELPDLLAVLSTSVSVKQVAEAVLPRIEEAVHATRLALLVDGKLAGARGIAAASVRQTLKNWTAPEAVELFDRNDDEAFPLRIALRCPLGSVRAWLLLGTRPDGSFYGRDDLDALSEIVAPLQRSVLAVAEREAQDRGRRRLDIQLRKSLSELSERVAMLERSHHQPIQAHSGDSHDEYRSPDRDEAGPGKHRSDGRGAGSGDCA